MRTRDRERVSLHENALGWLAGVPLWIALWWGVGALAWEEVAGRLLDSG